MRLFPKNSSRFDLLFLIPLLLTLSCAHRTESIPSESRGISASNSAQTAITDEFVTYRERDLYLARSRDLGIDAEIPCVIHFHGYRRYARDLEFRPMIDNFQFFQSMQKVQKQFVFIVPKGATGGKSGYDLDSRFGSEAQVQQLVNWVEDYTRARCSAIIISGHSGAYEVFHKLLPLRVKKSGSSREKSPKNSWIFRWKESWFFDALYIDLSSEIRSWLSVDSSRSVQNVYSSVTSRLSGSLPNHSRIKNVESEVPNHWSLLTGHHFIKFIENSSNLR